MRNADTAKVMTIAVRISACGSGSLISSAVTPSVTIGATPASPAMIRISRLVALPTSKKPIRTRVMLRSSSR
jgi:hypothetical protein